MVLRNTLVDYWRQIHREQAGYEEIKTPDYAQTAPCGSAPAIGITISENMYTTVIDDDRLRRSSP